RGGRNSSVHGGFFANGSQRDPRSFSPGCAQNGPGESVRSVVAMCADLRPRPRSTRSRTPANAPGRTSDPRPPPDGPGSCSAFFLVGAPFTRRNQAAQTVVDIKTPCACTFTVAFDGRSQADMRKAEFGLTVLPGPARSSSSMRFIDSRHQAQAMNAGV